MHLVKIANIQIGIIRVLILQESICLARFYQSTKRVDLIHYLRIVKA
jgi:hypothetical protein